jgi:hypothetical protein
MVQCDISREGRPPGRVPPAPPPLPDSFASVEVEVAPDEPIVRATGHVLAKLPATYDLDRAKKRREAAA